MTSRRVHVLSVRQPWAWATLHAGMRVVNREAERFEYRGPVLLHAGGTCTRKDYDAAVALLVRMGADFGKELKVPPLGDLPRGALVGVGRVVRADRHPVTGEISGTPGIDWSRGYCGYRLAGMLGLQLRSVSEVVDVQNNELDALMKMAQREFLATGIRGFFAGSRDDVPEVYRDALAKLEAQQW